MRGCWVLLCALLHSADGFLNSRIAHCVSNSTNTDDVYFIDSYFYNKMELIRFDSRVGRYVGYTEIGVKNAERANNDTAILQNERLQKDRYCVHNMGVYVQNILSKSVEPYAVLNAMPSGGSESVLVCSAFNFFPKDITVTWTNHQQPLRGAVVTSTGSMPDSDWYYQIHSQLEYSPRSGDQISCMIEHRSLKEPLVLDYEGALSDGDRNKVAIGASGLVLGLVLSLAGFLYYRHKSRGLILVPQH